MIDKTGGVDRLFNVRLNSKIQINGAEAAQRAGKRDAVNISRFSALVEQARTRALSSPDLRADRVEQVKSSIDSGQITVSTDIASAIINGAVKGRV